MGLYAIDCPICKKPYMWFSGNKTQVCKDCLDINKGEDKMEEEKKEEPEITEEVIAKVVSMMCVEWNKKITDFVLDTLTKPEEEKGMPNDIGQICAVAGLMGAIFNVSKLSSDKYILNSMVDTIQGNLDSIREDIKERGIELPTESNLVEIGLEQK